MVDVPWTSSGMCLRRCTSQVAGTVAVGPQSVSAAKIICLIALSADAGGSADEELRTCAHVARNHILSNFVHGGLTSLSVERQGVLVWPSVQRRRKAEGGGK